MNYVLINCHCILFFARKMKWCDVYPERLSFVLFFQIPTLAVFATLQCVQATGSVCTRLSQVFKRLKLNAINAL